MKRKPTEEQKEQAKLRRERFRTLCRQIDKLEPAKREEMAKKMLHVRTCENRVLSPHNTILLYMQAGAVTIVGGFQQWRKLGRTVKKGQHGLMIWGPATKKSESADEKEDMYFIPLTVFDVSQTEELGTKALPEPAKQLEEGVTL